MKKLITLFLLFVTPLMAQYGPWRYGYAPGDTGFAPYFPPEEAAVATNQYLPQYDNTLFWYKSTDIALDSTNDYSVVGTNYFGYSPADTVTNDFRPNGVSAFTYNWEDSRHIYVGANDVDFNYYDYPSQVSNDTVGTYNMWVTYDSNDTQNNLTDWNSLYATYLSVIMRQDLNRLYFALAVDNVTKFYFWAGFTNNHLNVPIMVTAVQDGVEPKLYINGQRAENTTTNTAADLTAWHDDIWGATAKPRWLLAADGTFDFESDLTDWVYWNTALTADEIATMYDNLKYQIEGRTNSGYGFGYPGDFDTNANKVIHYNFDLMVNNTQADISGQYNHGINSGATLEAITNGTKRTGVMSFDGVNDNVLIPVDTITEGTGVEAYTFAFWFNTDKDTQFQRLFEYNDDGIAPYIDINIFSSNTHFWVYHVGDTGGASDDSWFSGENYFSTGVWNHVATVGVSNSHVAFFLNGKQVYSNAFNNGFGDLGSSFGRYAGAARTGVTSLSGELDDFRIYQQGLNSTEITNIYDQTKSKYGY